MINRLDPHLSIRQQCELLKLNRSNVYYTRSRDFDEEANLANEIYEIWQRCPFYGYRKITEILKRQGYHANRKRVLRIMREMNIEAIYPKPHLSKPNREDMVYPYLLDGLDITHPNQVFATDITYLKFKEGFMYLIAIIDVYSRYVLSWRISNTLETGFCLEALEEAISKAVPDIVNTDQGSQFTSERWTTYLKEQGVDISMDGKGSYLDNIFIERVWRSVKYEEFYLNNYYSVTEGIECLDRYFKFYNEERPHQALNYKTPSEVYHGK